MATTPPPQGFVERMRRLIRGIVYLAILLLVIFIMSTSVVGTVGAGERGIRLRFSAVTGDVIESGLYFKIPFIESVEVMDVKVQKEQVESTAASKDLQTVASIVALNFHPNPERVTDLYKDVGVNYGDRIISPALQESVKATTAKFTAEELVTKRQEVRDEIKRTLQDKLTPRNILVDDFNIVDFNFSDSFNEAIEAKVTAEQSALAAKNKLEQVKFEAEQRIAEAKGKAEAMSVEATSLRNSPDILQLRALEKWNGILPLVTSGQLPFITLNDLTRASAAQQ